MLDIDIQNIVNEELKKLETETKNSIKEIKNIAINQAWKILQLTIASTIQIIEKSAEDMAGKDKKTIALNAISKFYDNVFMVVNVPFIPSILEGMLHKYVKIFLMSLVGSSIDAMVTTFRQVGIFKTKDQIKSLSFKKTKPKTKRKNK